MRGRLISAVALAAAVSGLVPGAGAAGHCDSNVVIFSGPDASPRWVNSGGVACGELGHNADRRIVNPGSDAVSIRYTVDLGVQTLTAVVDGLGIDAQTITLTRAQHDLGTFVYNSPRIPLPDGALSSGCITATVDLGFGEFESTSFHTLDSSCPDF